MFILYTFPSTLCMIYVCVGVCENLHIPNVRTTTHVKQETQVKTEKMAYFKYKFVSKNRIRKHINTRIK